MSDPMSNKSPITSGIPQGSVLRLILFLIFVNVYKSAVKLFAEDTKN